MIYPYPLGWGFDMMHSVNHRPLVFLDIETTGLGPFNSRVLEIGALRVENGMVVKKMKQLLHPDEPVPYFITNLTGITNADIQGMPSFADISKELLALLDGAIFVAHNVNFDYSFIKSEFSRIQVKFNHDRLCTVRLSKVLYPEQKSHKLDNLIARHGYTVASRHRAYDDAEVLYKFFVDSHAAFGLAIFRHMDKILVHAR
jgi:DNA polymerase III subunit epsilon